MRAPAASPSTDMAVLKAFPATVSRLAAVCGAVPLGPWIVMCDCSWQNPATPYFKPLPMPLIAPISFFAEGAMKSATKPAADHAATVVVAYEPLTTWLTEALPEISSSFVKALADEQTVQKAAGTPDFDAAWGALKRRLDDIVTRLSQSITNLAGVGPALTAFIAQQVDLNGQIDTARQTIETDTQAAMASIQSRVGHLPCYKEARSQLQRFQTEISQSVATIGDACTALASATKEVSGAVQELLGFLNNVIDEFRPIIAQLALADRADIPLLVQKLHLEVASDLWSDLAARAKA